MKKLLMTFCMAATLPVMAKPLIVATDGAYPPFSEIDSNGNMIGFDIDIAKALCAEMQRECEFKQIDWEGLIPALNNEQIDAIIASMNANDERRQVIEFTEPYYHNPGIFLRLKGSDVEMTETGLKGKTIGVLSASVFDSYATDHFAKWAKIDRYTTQDDANLDAKKGVVDVLFADKIVLQDGFLDREIGTGFEQFGEEINEPAYFGEGVSIGVRKADEALRQSFNQALKNIRANGEYKKVNDKYFSYDIYGK